MLPSHDMRLRVPIDDTLTYSFWIRFHPLAGGKFELENCGFTGKKPEFIRARKTAIGHPVDGAGPRCPGDASAIADRTIEHLADPIAASSCCGANCARISTPSPPAATRPASPAIRRMTR